MSARKRTRLVIEPVIQYSLVRQMIVQWSLHLLATLLLLSMLQVMLGGFFHPWSYHASRIGPALASLSVALVVLLPVFILQSLKLSNRFAGPIYRLRRELRQLREGQPYREMQFREDDYWQDLAAPINSIHLQLLGLNQKVAAYERRLNQLQSLPQESPTATPLVGPTSQPETETP